MPYIKVMISLHPDILEALDAVVKTEMVSRSGYIVKCLKNDPDVYDVLEGMKK